jgi:zinc protease
MKTTEFQLKNGLKVILTESHKSPVVSAQMWVRTGSADEKKKEEGISHFIEHLVFKGTRKFKVGEIASMIEGAGGELNAYTSFDQTVFYVTLSKQFTDTGLLAISEMMGFPIFDPKEIDNEREVVIEEIKRGKDSLGHRASEALFSTSYKKHAYGIPVIGYEKNIRDLSAKKIVDFYHSRYAPRNMFLLVSGDFQSKEMKGKVTKLFGEFKDYKIKKATRVKEPKQTKPRISVENATFEQSIAYLSWKIPSIKHKDIPTLDILSFVLGQGDSSRLVQKLRIQSAVVNSTGASSYTPTDDGLFAVSLGYNKDKYQEALQGVQEVLLEILTRPVSIDEIKRAVLNLESDEFYGMETVDGLSRRMGSLEFYFRDLKAQEKYLKALRAVTPADVLKAARKYLVPSTLSACIVTNDNTKKIQAQTQAWVKQFAKAILATKAVTVKRAQVKHAKIQTRHRGPSVAETEKIVLKNGTSVLLRPSFETQVISVKAAYLGGLRVEPDGCEGLIDLLGRTWSTGTAARTEDQISMETESMAAGLGPVAGRNSLGLGLDILSGFQERGADLFLDVLTDPQFPTNFVEREKHIQLEQIKSRADNPAQLCIRHFMEAMFSGHPYAKDMLGTPGSLVKVTHKSLQDYWGKVCGTQNLTLALSGNFDRDLWLEKIEAALTPLSKGQKHLKPLPLSPITENIHCYEKSAKEQSHVVYGFRGLSLKDDNRYTLQIIQSILAGQGGRLFLELRDKNSLAYSVSPMRMEGVETGYFGAYIGCSPEKVQKAIDMMKEQFQLLCEVSVGAPELERAQRYLVGRNDIDLQRTSAIASSVLYNDIYGIDYNEAFTCAEKYFAVTSEDVQKLAQKIFSQKQVISIVGTSDIKG